MALERELAVYQRERPGWVAAGKVGRWVVIHGEEVVGFYGDLELAMEAGYERFGLDELFMARQVAAEDNPVTAEDNPVTAARRAVHAHRRS